jgi:lipoprotein-anchoring transpeptidase ErfK/SrfK
LQQELRSLEEAIARVEMMSVATDSSQSAGPGQAEAQEWESEPSKESVQRTALSLLRTRPRTLLLSGLSAFAVIAAGVVYKLSQRENAKRSDSVESSRPELAQTAVAGGVEGVSANAPSHIYGRQLVFYRSIHPAGTIVIAKSQRFLYLLRPNHVAIRYTVGLGAECARAVGLLHISAKEVWTDETSALAPGPNRGRGHFGPRSLALADTGHRIHGAGSVYPGRQGAIGCFPVRNDDLVDLYDRVALGAKVVIH